MDDQWILITGAARRIGAEIARTLHGAGANIALHYHRSMSEATALCDDLNSSRAGSAIPFQADITETATLREFVDQIVAKTGRLDGLINNASTFYPTPIETITERQWDDLIGTNLKAPLFLCSAAVPHLRKTGGTIVNMIDIYARRPLRQHPLYGPAKAALAALTVSLARDLGPQIRVNGISPGAILWPEDQKDTKEQLEILNRVPLERTGTPAELAKCVLFLVRDATYVNGQIIAVDGGRSAGW